MAARYTQYTNLQAVLLLLTGALTGVSAAFSGALSAASAAITGAITGASATLTGLLTTGTFKCGTGSSTLSLIKTGTVTVNPGSLTTLTGEVITVTISGAAVGDLVVLCPVAAFEALVVGGARVSATDTVKFIVFNGTAGTIDAASASWNYFILRVA
jgi:hypothetical protein